MKRIGVAASVALAAVLASGCGGSSPSESGTPSVTVDGQALWDGLSDMGRQELCGGPLDQTKIDFFTQITFAPKKPTRQQSLDLAAQLSDAYRRFC